MSTLALRLDVMDNSHPLQPNRPLSYTVVGFACGRAAIVRLDMGESGRWILHVARPREAFQILPMKFKDPHAALLHVEAWARETEQRLSV